VSFRPIADYALLSDRHSAALVSLDGSIDWLCFPRFDSPSIFGRLLGESAGHWSLRAPNARSVTRRYVDRTVVLETTYVTATGTAVVLDELAAGGGNRGHALGRDAPHLLLREVTCTQGRRRAARRLRPATGVRPRRPFVRRRRRRLLPPGGADTLVSRAGH
jgi:GH15 family glucan-1,4-alpha-glucosidase